MTEPALHFSVPFALLSVAGADPVLCSLASVSAILPDLDVFVGVHRSSTHSVMLHGLFVMLATLMRAIDPNVSYAVLAIGIGLISHGLLDVVTGYSPVCGRCPGKSSPSSSDCK